MTNPNWRREEDREDREGRRSDPYSSGAEWSGSRRAEEFETGPFEPNEGQRSNRDRGWNAGGSGSNYGNQDRGGQGGYGNQGYGSSPSSNRSRGNWNPGTFSGRSPNYGTEQGEFSGRGPKGYQRSDERIREEVCDCLTDDGRIDASNIEVTVSGGEVTLTGTVSNRAQKREVEDLVERMSGVRDVHNSIRVDNDSRRGSSSSTYGQESSSSPSSFQGSQTSHGNEGSQGSQKTPGRTSDTPKR